MIPGTWKITVEPTQEPISVDEASAFAKVADPQEMAVLASMIKAARRELEAKLNRQLVTATYVLYLDDFPGYDDMIRLPMPPLASVSSITYVDTASVTQTLAPADYVVDIVSEPGQVRPAYQGEWPECRGYHNDVCITFVAGWPVTNGVPTTPEPLREWIRRRVTSLSEHRESVVTGTIVSPFPEDFERGLLSDYLLPEAV